jgi:hypothetical protein
LKFWNVLARGHDNDLEAIGNQQSNRESAAVPLRTWRNWLLSEQLGELRSRINGNEIGGYLLLNGPSAQN